MTEHAKVQSPESVQPSVGSHGPSKKKIPLAWPVIDSEMKDAAVKALDEKLVMGESVYKFEDEFARYCGTKFAISTGSGTAALSIALQSLGIGSGSQVVTTPFSFIATANAVIHTGAEPRFADVENSDINLSPEETRKAMTPKTRAIIPVHLYGHPSRIDEFREIAQEKDVKLIEDACQAHGAEVNGRKAGSIGDAGCFSFYPAKNMTVGGDGGMITTNDEDLAEAARSIRDCGRNKNSKYHMGRIGYTSRLNSVNAAIGRIQLRRLDGWNESRRRLASRYRKELDGVQGLALPSTERAGVRGVYHLFVVRSKSREKLKDYLESNRVETGVHYPVPIHLQTPYVQSYGYSEGAYPLSEKLSAEVLSLPMYPDLTESQVSEVCSLIKESLSKQ